MRKTNSPSPIIGGGARGGGLSLTYLRLLFWLKGKLLLRGYQRSGTALTGVILTLVFLLPFAVSLAGGALIGFLDLAPPYNGHLLRAVLLMVYGFWVMSPLLGFAMNDSYDVTRLFLYPVSVRQIFLGVIFGSFLDFPVLFLLPTMLVVFIGFTHSVAAFGIILLTMALFLLHTFSLSQAVLLANAGILRSRRYRDLAMVLVTLFSILFYIFWREMSTYAGQMNWIGLVQSPLWEALNYLPPGLAARAIAAAGSGQMLPALEYLLSLAGFTVVTFILAAEFLKRVYAGDAVRLSARTRASAPTPAPTTPISSAAQVPAEPVRRPRFTFRTGLPPVVEAMVEKEARYFVRDPYFKVILLNLAYMLVVGFFAIKPTGVIMRPEIRVVMAWVMMSLPLLIEMQLVCNLFGTEGSAASVLFLFPCSRRQVLIGKNVALFVVLSALNILFMVILAGIAGVLDYVSLLVCWIELALIVFLAIGNLASIYFPLRLVMRGWRMRPNSASRGCGYFFVYWGVMIVAFVLLLPVIGALALPGFNLVNPYWLTLSIPLAVAYAIGLYALSLHLAGPLLQAREETIIAKVSQPEE